MASASGYRFFVVPHTHWDREWYVPLEHFRLELAALVDDVLDVLERDESFRSFTLDGQAIVLEDYVELRPENERRLRELLAKGRLVVGPSYVLPDELLVGQESLVRNLLLGRAVCERFGARASGAGHMPDSFGHPAQLPQILRGFGIESFLFARGQGDELDDVGRVFRWRAPDGSDVTAFNLLGHYDNAAWLASADDLRQRAERLVAEHREDLHRAALRDVLLLNGSDHTPIEPELPRLLPDGRFQIGSLDEYLAAARPRRPPVYEGELLGSREKNVLRGVNSARMYLKQANERAERRLLAAETAAALAALDGRTPFPTADFRFAWRELLRNHPHDSICGCSVDEVHEDMLGRYERLERTIDVLERKALAPLPLDPAQAGELYRPAPRTEVTLLNPLPWRRCRLVGGRVVELAGFARETVSLTPPPARAPSHKRAIENDRYRVEAAANGTLTVVDLATGTRHKGLHRFEDDPDRGDLYTFCPVEGASIWRSDAKAVERSARVLRAGPTVSELELVVGRIRTIVRLVAGIDRIELETDVDNRTRDHRLRVVFPAPSAGETVRAESQFAVVERPLVPDPPRVPWHEPPDATDHTLGAVALGDLNVFTKGLPEYEARPSPPELALTLLRCVGALSRPTGALSTRRSAAGPRIATPGGQCLGRHRFEYALRLGRLDDTELVRAAHDYRFAFLAGPVVDPQPPPLELSGDPVAFSSLKGAEDGDGVVLRLYNPGRERARVRVETTVSLARCRLDETEEQPLGRRAITVAPGRIVTLRLRS